MAEEPPTTTGFTTEAATASVKTYFLRFRWEPPRVDPHFISARAFLERVESSSGK